MYYSYVEIEYVATSFSPTWTDLAAKLLNIPVCDTCNNKVDADLVDITQYNKL